MIQVVQGGWLRVRDTLSPGHFEVVSGRQTLHLDPSRVYIFRGEEISKDDAEKIWESQPEWVKRGLTLDKWIRETGWYADILRHGF
jgi:hypothetical protein